jgi:hypothetical protein
MSLATQLHLVWNLRMCGSIYPLNKRTGTETFTLLLPDPIIHKRDTIFLFKIKMANFKTLYPREAGTLSINNTTFISLLFFVR